MSSTDTPRRFDSAWFARRKGLVIVVVWAVAIGVLAFVTPSVTVREQTHAAQALPRLDAAVGDAAGLLTGQPYGYSLTPLTSDGACDITPVRSGEEYSRTVTVYTGRKAARSAVEDLYDKLKDRYRLETDSFSARPLFFGTTDDYVDFELRQEPEYVVWRATTGCRPAGAAVGELAPAFSPGARSVAFLRKLGVTDPTWTSASTECGDLAGPGGKAKTVTGVGELPKDTKADVSKLAEALPDDVKVVIDSAKLLSYRDEGVTHAVGIDGRTVTATATTGCDG